jgi:hypothetical protein
MNKLNATLIASVVCASVAACAQSPTALTPGHTFGPGHNAAAAGGHGFGSGHNVAPDGGHTFGSGGITSAAGHGFGPGHLSDETTTVASDTTSRGGHGFGPGH